MQHPEAAITQSPTPELGETLRVVSKDTATLRFQWNSRVHILPPGGEVYMPFDAVKLYCGDPRATSLVRTLRDSIGIVSFLPDRETEVRRLRLLYMAPFGEYMAAESAGGIFQAAKPSAPGPLGSSAFEGVRVPQVEVYNIQGQRVVTVLDDPEGTTVMMTQQTQSESAALQVAFAQQQQLINVMAQRLGMDPATGSLLNAPNVTGEEEPADGEDGMGEAPEGSARDTHPGPSNPTHPDDEGELITDDQGNPKTFYDQRDGAIKTKRKRPPHDPSTIDDLPEDAI